MFPIISLLKKKNLMQKFLKFLPQYDLKIYFVF